MYARLAMATVLVALIGACSPSVYGLAQERAYSPDEYRHAAAHDIPAVIRGNPFPRPDAEARAATLAAMQGTRWSPDVPLARPAHFIDGGRPAAGTGYWVAVYLNADADLRTDTLCDPQTAVKARPDAGRLEARMAFCRGAQLLSTSVGTGERVADPADPRYAEMITRMTRALFPHREYRREGPAEGALRRR